MQEGRKVEDIINNNDNSIQRRVNLMGQELANVGISDVSVEVTIKVKGSDSGGSFEKVRTGKFAKFVKGKGPGKVGGTDDNAKPADQPTTKTVQRASVFSSAPDGSGLDADGS
tara:strand:- start:9254 stop:9592 length:339 start_codon:yes stop_codon:yes gene_type:complete